MVSACYRIDMTTNDSVNNTEIKPVELRTPRASEREEMLAGRLYNPADPELTALRERAGDLCLTFNQLPHNQASERARILDQLFPEHGEAIEILGPLQCDYGVHTTIGNRVFINYNFTVLDCAPVHIGDDVLIGPNVSLLPPMHPLRWQDRNLRQTATGDYYDYEYGLPITIESNCWIGGNVTILGNVTIGEGSVIGAGAVVTKDIPAHSIAVGNPAHVLRQIDDTDDAASLQSYAQ